MLNVIRVSAMRNMPVVMGERQVGLFHEACFDQTRKRVCAFVVSCGMRGKKIVSTPHIRGIADGFILIDARDRYRHSDGQSTSVFVRDTSGLLVGRITDYAIEPSTMEVMAMEMILRYSLRQNANRVWIYAYNQVQDGDELSIPLDLSSQLLFSREENDICGYPP